MVKEISALPDEILQQSMKNMSTSIIFRVCKQSRRLTLLADNGQVWCKKWLAVRTSRELKVVMAQPVLLQHIRHLDLSFSFLHENEIMILLRNIRSLESIRLCCLDSQLTDGLLSRILGTQGGKLKELSLDRSYHLTNLAIEEIGRLCPRLESLSLYACMFSNSAIHVLAESPCAQSLRSLNIGRCHLLEIPNIGKDMNQFVQLRQLNLSCNDSLIPLQFVELVKRMHRLSIIDVTDCVEICRKDVSAVQTLRPKLKITHSSKLDDYTPASIRAYLLSLQLDRI